MKMRIGAKLMPGGDTGCGCCHGRGGLGRLSHPPELAKRVVLVTGGRLSADTSARLEEMEPAVLATPFSIDKARRLVLQKLRELGL